MVSEPSSPRVSHEPVRGVSRGSPSNELDFMSSSNTVSGLGVHSGGVVIEIVEEVVVDSERSLDRSVVHDLSLDLRDGPLLHGLVLGGRVLGRPVLAVVALSSVALGGLTRRSIERSTTTLALVGASGVFVGDDVVPGTDGGTTVATTTSALDHGLRGHNGTRGGFRGDASTIRESTSGGESPTSTTRSLVQDVELTVAPLLTGIERGGGVGEDDRHKGENENRSPDHDCFSFQKRKKQNTTTIKKHVGRDNGPLLLCGGYQTQEIGFLLI